MESVLVESEALANIGKLKPDLFPAWTEQELQTLLESIRINGHNWEQIVEDLKPRTIASCKTGVEQI